MSAFRSRRLAPAAVLVAFAVSGAAVAYPASSREDQKFDIVLAGYFVEFQTNARYDPNGLPISAFINLEDTLGLDSDRTVFRLEGSWHVRRKHRLSAGYMLLSRDSELTVLDEPLEWGDYVFDAGASVSSKFDTRVFRLAYDYHIFAKPKFVFGINAGLSLFEFDTGVLGEATLRDSTSVVVEQVAERFDLLAPVPVLGLHISFRFAKNWNLWGRGSYFALDADEWDAGLLDTLIGIGYEPWKHVGFGVAWDIFRIDYTEEKRDRLEVDYNFDGLTAYLRFMF